MSTKLAFTVPAESNASSMGRPASARPRDLSVLRAERSPASPVEQVQPPPVVIGSAGGELSFVLAQGAGGVHVARAHRRRDGARLHCSALFQDQETFLEWLDADDMRFTHPLVFQQLKRTFAEMALRRETHSALRG
jgi:hypothetical protein